uniref:WAP domain-containing protein n=1 Tax=Calidris pygmaea TaxID=425635 RepID=A0A8C3JCG0_9CHAR
MGPQTPRAMSTHGLSSEPPRDGPLPPAERDAAVVPRHGATQCLEECEADSQCPWGQRCTRTGCGRVCVDTPGGETRLKGACPIPSGRGTCLDLCSLDEECPWGHKCCSNGCGHHLVAPGQLASPVQREQEMSLRQATQSLSSGFSTSAMW